MKLMIAFFLILACAMQAPGQSPAPTRMGDGGSGTGMGVQAPGQSPAPTSEGKDRAARRRRPRTEIVFQRGEGKALVFVDFRGEADKAVAREAEKLGRYAGIATETAQEPAPKGCPAEAARNMVETGRAGAVVAIWAGTTNAPAIVAQPEDRVAVVNATRLADADPAVAETRLVKELWRAAAFALGGYASDYPGVMKPVFQTADLDANTMLMFCPPVAGKVGEAAKAAGIAPLRAVPKK